MKVNILGYPVDNGSVSECADAIMTNLTLDHLTCTWLACLNPHSYVVALSDPYFALALHGANWLVPDGSGVVWASSVLGGKVCERVTGSDVFSALHQRMNAAGGLSVFFLGASETTLAQIRTRMALDFPNIRVAGTYSPPFKPTYSEQELAEMISAVNATRPDVLWVGMTAPKQEKWIFENRDRLEVRFAAAVGAVFDFYTGNVKRSHPLFQRLGLEWLPRLLQQPHRLWRRMFVSAPIFVLHVMRARWRQRKIGS
jgi:N-acetylglucosaminyldiphosphoundecaprenol N-acetyl-beta-D-mannosaminyltransferase